MPYILVYADINECASNNGGCSDGCNNTKGSYYCTCSSGYELSGDNVTCIGESKVNYLFSSKIVYSGMYMYKNSVTYIVKYNMRHVERVHTIKDEVPPIKDTLQHKFS